MFQHFFTAKMFTGYELKCPETADSWKLLNRPSHPRFDTRFQIVLSDNPLFKNHGIFSTVSSWWRYSLLSIRFLSVCFNSSNTAHCLQWTQQKAVKIQAKKRLFAGQAVRFRTSEPTLKSSRFCTEGFDTVVTGL